VKPNLEMTPKLLRMCVLKGFSWIETSLKPRRGFGFQLGFTSPETYQLLLVKDIKEEVSRFQREQVYQSPCASCCCAGSLSFPYHDGEGETMGLAAGSLFVSEFPCLQCGLRRKLSRSKLGHRRGQKKDVARPAVRLVKCNTFLPAASYEGLFARFVIAWSLRGGPRWVSQCLDRGAR
jgi:hypothetical protein